MSYVEQENKPYHEKGGHKLRGDFQRDVKALHRYLRYNPNFRVDPAKALFIRRSMLRDPKNGK